MSIKIFVPKSKNTKNTKNHKRIISILDNLENCKIIVDSKKAKEAQYIVFPDIIWNIFKKGIFKNTLSQVYKQIKKSGIIPKNNIKSLQT